MSPSPCGPNGTRWRRIAPLNRSLGQFELYSQNIQFIRSVNDADARAVFRQNPSRTLPSKGRYQPIRLRKAAGAVHPMAERLNLCRIDFRFLNSPEQRWHRPRCSSQAIESTASNSPSKKACRTNSHSAQAPAVLLRDSGAGGAIMAIRSVLLSQNISWLA